MESKVEYARDAERNKSSVCCNDIGRYQPVNA